jgi:CheY-like chemotaxis protein
MNGETRRKTVLVVDDEEAIRWLASLALVEAGYDVIEARDGDEALATLDTDETIDLLITDLMTPGSLEGDALVARCLRRRPDLKVLYVTGFVERLFDRKPTLAAGEAFLEKPFTMNGLKEAVAYVLWGRISARARVLATQPSVLRPGEQRLVWA